MKIIHICSYFNSSGLYFNLFHSLSKVITHQEVYVPICQGEDDRQQHRGVHISFRKCFKMLDRFFYLKKINKIWDDFSDIEEFCNNNKYVVHAHSLFINGKIALMHKHTTGSKYIVAVRSTDIFVFFRFLFFLRHTGFEILREAEKIIFIAPHLLERLLDYTNDKNLQSVIRKKSYIIPNGIDEYWFNNMYNDQRNIDPLSVIYVGSLIPRKNLHKLILACVLLRIRGLEVNLQVVGTGKSFYSFVLKMIMKSIPWIKYKGYVANREALINYYRGSSIFALPSVGETFGLVYIEALSQSRKVLYTKGDGVDGLVDDFDNTIGVKPSIFNIARGLRHLIEHQTINEQVDLEQFRWDKIAEIYCEIYHEI